MRVTESPVPIAATVATFGIETATTGVNALPPPVPPLTSFVIVSVVVASTLRSFAFVMLAPFSTRAEVVRSSMSMPTEAPKPIALPPPSTLASTVTLLSVVDSALTSTSVPLPFKVRAAPCSM